MLKDFSESNPNFKDSKYIMLNIAAFKFNDKRVNNEKLENFFSILNNIFPDITVKNFFESFAQDPTSLVLYNSMWPIGAKTWISNKESSIFYENERKYFEKLLTENKPFTKEDKNRLMYPDRDGNTLAHHVAKKGDMVFYQKLVNQLDGREGGYFHTKNAKAETAFQLRPMVKCERNALIGTIAAAPITAGLAIGTLFLAAGLGGPFGVAIWALAWGGAALIGSAAVGSLYDKFLTPFRSTEPDNKSPVPSIIPA